MDGFLLKVAYEPVAEPGTEEEEEEVDVPEDGLADSHCWSEENTRLPKVEEDEQMSSLVFRLLKQVINYTHFLLHSH